MSLNTPATNDDDFPKITKHYCRDNVFFYDQLLVAAKNRRDWNLELVEYLLAHDEISAMKAAERKTDIQNECNRCIASIRMEEVSNSQQNTVANIMGEFGMECQRTYEIYMLDELYARSKIRDIL